MRSALVEVRPRLLWRLAKSDGGGGEVVPTEGLDIGVVNARFVKPMDMEMVQKALTVSDFVVTAEEAMLMGGFGSALLEAANNEYKTIF